MNVPTAKLGQGVTVQFDYLRDREARRAEHERRMRNALEILADLQTWDDATPAAVAYRVRATAREGLGRDAAA